MINTALFVDDEKNILNSLVRIFSDSDVRVLTAPNGPQGLEVLKHNEVAVIVSDYLMPGMTGVDFLQAAKNISPDSVRILMTGCTDVHIAIEAINRGQVYRFITKPWDTDELRNTVFDSINAFSVVQAMKRADKATLLSLAQTIELKDPYTRGHCNRVADFSLQIADGLGLPNWKTEEIRHGSWLHDCGKIGVPEATLNHPGVLSPEQMDLVKKHPVLGADVARVANLSETIINVILYHHERYDGQGYPIGLAGDMIPLEARIVSVADVFDALTSDRPYRPKWTVEAAVELLTNSKNTFFDPTLVDIFLKSLGNLRDNRYEPTSSKS